MRCSGRLGTSSDAGAQHDDRSKLRMRYLITGGAGFIGSHIVDALTMRGEDVLVLDADAGASP